MTRLTGYQPQYFPRLHYFARVLDSDIFAISDYLQYVRKHSYPTNDGKTVRGFSYQAHTPIKTAEGPLLLLDIPVRKGGIEGRQAMSDALIDYATPWQQKNLNKIHCHYHKAPQFNKIFPGLSVVMTQQYKTLADCTTASMFWAFSVLFELPLNSQVATIEQIQSTLPQEPFRLKKIVLLSTSAIAPPDKTQGRDANDWLIEQCKQFGAEEYYYGGTSAAAYMDFDRFINAGIVLKEQNWKCEAYPQLHGDFIPNLSIIDLLMNVPPEEARARFSGTREASFVQ